MTDYIETPLAPLQVPGYRTRGLVYASATTTVAKAVREADGVRVVLKYPTSQHPSLAEVARYRHEHAVLQQLDGAAVVRALGLEQVDHRHVLVCEDVSAVSLAERWPSGLAGGPASGPPSGRSLVGEFLAIAIGLAHALAEVHAAGVIHKDVSPSNAVIQRATGAIKLIDFGIAARLSRETPALEPPAVLEGTLSFMSPEQTGRMNCAIDARSDLYAAGATLHALLAGAPPFTASDPLALVHAHLALAPTPLEAIVPGLPPVLGQIVRKLLAKSVDDRYQTARALAHDLEEVRRQWCSAGSVAPFALGAADTTGKLEVPRSLHGRAAEVATLLAAFERSAAGMPELLVISGSSGIGKTALVGELQRPIALHRGYFAAGKFDAYNRNVPYSAVSVAFGELVHYLLMEPAAWVQALRDDIITAAAGNAQLLVEVIPSLELLIGPQPAVPPAPPRTSQARLDSTFRAFVGVLARTEHPLVMFLDDIQWADAPSLHLIETLLMHAGQRAFLIVATCRDSEVSAAHAAMVMVDDVRRAGTPVSWIQLGPLDIDDSQALIAGVLRMPGQAVHQLAELLHSRTDGNPFFLVQLLQALSHDGLLVHRAGAWSWDLAQIRDHGLTHDVVELMAARLATVPGPTRELLAIAACIGARFSVAELAQATGRAPAEVEDALRPALASELIVPEARRSGNPDQLAHHRFLHDRVHQAAHALLDDDTARREHLAIGRRLLERVPEAELDAQIFEIVGHLNAGLPCLSDPAERARIAGLNHRAGRRAKAASAYRPAAQHFATAMTLLGDQVWDTDHELALELHCERADCEYVIGDLEMSDALTERALTHCRSNLERARVAAIRILMYITAGKFARSAEVGIAMLRLFGHDVPADRQGARQAGRLQRKITEDALAGIDVAALVDRPEVRDPENRAVMQILALTTIASYFASDIVLNAFVCDLMVYLSISHGNTPESAFGYVVFGSAQRNRGQLRRGYEFGVLATRLAERLGDPMVLVRVGNHFADYLNPFFNHLETNLTYYRRTLELGPRLGDLLYSVWAANFIPLLRTMKGDPLAEVYDDAARRIDFVRQCNDEPILQAYVMHLQMIRALRGLTPARNSLDEGDFNEQATIAFHLRREYRAAIVFNAPYRTGVHVVFRDFAAALASAQRFEDVRAADMGFWTTTNHFFYQALALAGLYPDSGPDDQPAMLAKLETNRAMLAGWAETCAANFAHRRDLIAAEIARCLGRSDDAARLYDASLEGARAGQFHNDVALAAEAAAQFHRARGSALAAHAYLVEAHYAYLRWGADGKVAELERAHPELVAPRGPATPGARTSSGATASRSATSSARALDFSTAMKAAQALSAEIDRAALIAALLHLAMENAGARRVWLVLNEVAGLQLVARAAVDQATAEGTAGDLPLAIDRAPELPGAILQYVARTREPLVLADAAREGRFRHEPEVVARGARSLACVPLLRQGRLTGLLYLENDLVDGAFPADRVELLQLIAAQAAISLENAALYDDLEARVAARTAELAERNRGMRLVLDNVAQGFITIDLDGVMASERSAVVDRWFGAAPAGTRFGDLVAARAPQFALALDIGLYSLRHRLLPFDVVSLQLPTQLALGERSFEVAYSEIRHGDEPERLLLIATEVTARIVAERAERAERDLFAMFRRLTVDRSGFEEFVREAGEQLASLDPASGAAPGAVRDKRVVHTLKGNCALFGLDGYAALCHELEAELEAQEPEPLTTEQRERLRAAWRDRVAKLSELLGDPLRDAVEIERSELMQAAERARSGMTGRELAALLVSWSDEPVARRFGRLAHHARQLARQLGKGALAVAIDDSGLRLDAARWAPLFAALVHVIRNAVDHGIEPPDERARAGKPAGGSLALVASGSPAAFRITIRDDGRGIDWDAVRRRAQRAGAPSATPQDLEAALFLDGFSTRDHASATSGRGVGMAALRDAVRSLGGTIAIDTAPGAGTAMTFEFRADRSNLATGS